MKLELLQELSQAGTKVKYATLCEAFEVEKKTGKSKQLQIKDFERYAKLEKDGTWFTVIEVYETPLEKVDNRKNNGKSEASLKALDENRYEQESFFKEDELQLAILWTLGLRAYDSGWRETTKQPAYIPSNELYIAIGLCNDFFKGLTENQYYYTTTNSKAESNTKEYYCYKYQADIAFNGIYDDMKKRTITSFTQLKRKKLLDFAYWKQYRTVYGDIVPCTDTDMIAIHERRFDTLEWFNANHPEKQLANVGDLYTRLTPIEFKSAMDKLNELLKEDIQDYACYHSCFKVIYSLRAIRKELINRGFEIGTTKDEFIRAFRENMAEVVERINNKFLERHIARLEKVRDEHFQKLDEYEQKQQEQQVIRQRTFGRGRIINNEKAPFTAMTDNEVYNKTKELMTLGIQQNLSDDQLEVQKNINDIASKNVMLEASRSN